MKKTHQTVLDELVSSGRPMYAMELIDLAKLFPGTVYLALGALESSGFVVSEWDGPERGKRRRIYQHTPKGYLARSWAGSKV